MTWEPGVIGAFRTILGDRMSALVVYGSAVTGDSIPGLSDLDLLVVLADELTTDDAIGIQRLMPTPPDVAYASTEYSAADEPVPHLVPGAFRVLTGDLDESFVLGPSDLIRSSEETLQQLPSLVQTDVRDWTGAIGEKRKRQVRLMMTRLKPAIRATLVRSGEPPLDVWRSPWDDLVVRWRRYDVERADSLADLLTRLRARPRRYQLCGEALIRLLKSLT